MIHNDNNIYDIAIAHRTLSTHTMCFYYYCLCVSQKTLEYTSNCVFHRNKTESIGQSASFGQHRD